MSNKPTHLDSKITGNLAVTYIQVIFEEHGWIFRRADGTNDYGIDSEVEIVDQNSVTGRIFKCQIKGTENVVFDDKGYCSVQVNATTWNNWKELNIPVVAMLCDVERNVTFWALPLAYDPKAGAASVSIKFSKDHSLNDSMNEFIAILSTWLDAFPKKNILLEVPFYHRLYTEDLKPLINWGDAGMPLEEEINMQARIFYSHVLELRSSLGFTNQMIIPFSSWLIRNEGLWDDGTMLSHGTASELLTYIGHFYEETMERLKTRLRKVTPSLENNELINYFKLHPLMQEFPNMEIHYAHPSAIDPKFHAHIESVLKVFGYERYTWRPRKK